MFVENTVRGRNVENSDASGLERARHVNALIMEEEHSATPKDVLKLLVNHPRSANNMGEAKPVGPLAAQRMQLMGRTIVNDMDLDAT
jgi:hypothetical protein